MVTQVTKFITENGKEYDTHADAVRAELDDKFGVELENAMKRADIMAGYSVELDGLINAITGGHPAMTNPVRDVLVGYFNMTNITASVADRNRMLDDALTIIVAGINWLDVVQQAALRGDDVREHTIAKSKENMTGMYHNFTEKWCPKKIEKDVDSSK